MYLPDQRKTISKIMWIIFLADLSECDTASKSKKARLSAEGTTIIFFSFYLL